MPFETNNAADLAALLSLTDTPTGVEFDGGSGIIVAVAVDPSGDAQLLIDPDADVSRDVRDSHQADPALFRSAKSSDAQADYIQASTTEITKYKRPPNG